MLPFGGESSGGGAFVVSAEDPRWAYGEQRFNLIGWLAARARGAQCRYVVTFAAAGRSAIHSGEWSLRPTRSRPQVAGRRPIQDGEVDAQNEDGS